MALFDRSLWPDTVRWPYFRLCLGMGLAPVILATVLSAAAFAVAGMSEPTWPGVMAVTEDAAVVFFVVTLAFTLTAGLIGVAALWALSARGWTIWTLTGAGLGAAIALLHHMTGEQPGSPLEIGVAVGIGAAVFFLIRLIAGVRRGSAG